MFSSVFQMFWQSRTNRAGRTQAKSRTTAGWPKSRIALQTALDVFGCFAEQDKALRTVIVFFGCSTGCYGFSDAFRVFFRRFQMFCKAGQAFGRLSRPQGT